MILGDKRVSPPSFGCPTWTSLPWTLPTPGGSACCWPRPIRLTSPMPMLPCVPSVSVVGWSRATRRTSRDSHQLFGFTASRRDNRGGSPWVDGVVGGLLPATGSLRAGPGTALAGKSARTDSMALMATGPPLAHGDLPLPSDHAGSESAASGTTGSTSDGSSTCATIRTISSREGCRPAGCARNRGVVRFRHSSPSSWFAGNGGGVLFGGVRPGLPRGCGSGPSSRRGWH